ncbi:DHH family phosphoesterase [Ruminococcus sp.]|uniref:DHH family phosphoesterase n=1 Tax=Ruminococcus sp. TaxID=41978 RepID=UPI00388F79F5
MKRKVWTAHPVCLILAVLMIPMSAATFMYNKILGVVEFAVTALVVVLIFVLAMRFPNYMRDIVASAMKKSFSPNKKGLEAIQTPVVIYGKHGEIIAYNADFRKSFLDNYDGTNLHIGTFIAGVNPADAPKLGVFDTQYAGRRYSALAYEVENGVMVEFLDDTYYKHIADMYHDTKASVALLVFDNIEDFTADTDQDAAAAHLAAENLLYRWATDHNILLRRLGENRYIAVFEDVTLRRQMEGKFKLLDEIRAIRYHGRPATLSVGVGHDCDSITLSASQAKKALDMALGRGGDQVAVLNGNEYVFYGGVAKGVEKTSKVKVRAISQQISEAIDQADTVLITGHRFSDLDCIGAAAGLYAMVTKRYNKTCYIVTDKERTMALDMIERLSETRGEMFISPQHGILLTGPRTLLFIVDTHSPDFVEGDKLYNHCGNVIIIDHHRKMVNFIDSAGIFLHEPSASSASELVTEVVEYLADDALNHHEAEALLAGIMLDTKNFVINTGVRTFEAAAYLRKKGADTVAVRNLFANSLDNYRDKSKLVSSAQIVNHCAITVAPDEMMRNSRVVCAQAADDLLSIQDTYASFVISRIDQHTVNISARSFGRINVQLVMEALGGGGHQTMAAVQLRGVSLEEAKEKLIETLDEIL